MKRITRARSLDTLSSLIGSVVRNTLKRLFAFPLFVVFSALTVAFGVAAVLSHDFQRFPDETVLGFESCLPTASKFCEIWSTRPWYKKIDMPVTFTLAMLAQILAIGLALSDDILEQQYTDIAALAAWSFFVLATATAYEPASFDPTAVTGPGFRYTLVALAFSFLAVLAATWLVEQDEEVKKSKLPKRIGYVELRSYKMSTSCNDGGDTQTNEGWSLVLGRNSRSSSFDSQPEQPHFIQGRLYDSDADFSVNEDVTAMLETSSQHADVEVEDDNTVFEKEETNSGNAPSAHVNKEPKRRVTFSDVRHVILDDAANKSSVAPEDDDVW